MYRVEATKEFEKQAKKVLSPSEQLRLEMLKNRLAENPYIGKPLGFTFFRELKIGSKRAYYVIQEQNILLALVGHKNDQHKHIILIRKKFNL